MSRLIIIAILSIVVLHLQGQTMLVLEKPGTRHNFKYTVSDYIRLKQISSDSIISGKITSLSDSMIVINRGMPIELSDISIVYKERWGFSLLQKATLLAGTLYLGISALNGLLNNDSPVLPKETLIIGGSLTVAGLALIPLTKRQIHPGNGIWRLVIFDFSK